MGGCRCSYKNCPSATKTTENIHFFHYPVKQAERCRKWIENARKPAFFDLAEDQLRNKVVCELHFEEKCFTNIEKKRLLHDAVPTLDVGCEDEPQSEIYQIRNFEDVQVLPANADGTLFTVDTDSMQQEEVTEEVESYIYKDGMLVPLSRKQSHSRNEDFVYSLEDELKEKPEGFFDLMDDDKPDFILNKLRGNGLQCERVTDDSNESSSTSYSKPEKKNFKVANVRMKYAKQIQQHSREIASIKRVLQKQKPAVCSRMGRTAALQTLRNHIPPTLYTLVNLHLNKGDFKDCPAKEAEFFRTVYHVSPEVYGLLKDKYGWNMPEPSELSECKKEQV